MSSPSPKLFYRTVFLAPLLLLITQSSAFADPDRSSNPFRVDKPRKQSCAEGMQNATTLGPEAIAKACKGYASYDDYLAMFFRNEKPRPQNAGRSGAETLVCYPSADESVVTCRGKTYRRETSGSTSESLTKAIRAGRYSNDDDGASGNSAKSGGAN